MELINQLKTYGIDFTSSVYEDEVTYIADLKQFIHSYEFLQLGQAIKRKQWQAASMKVQTMSAKAKNMGMTGWEHLFTGMRQNINRKNESEALQIMSVVTAKRVKLMELL